MQKQALSLDRMKKEGMYMKYLFKGGTVVSGQEMKRQDILTEDEKIIAVEASIEDAKAQVIDAEGKLLFPGFIDAHTHMALDVCDTITADKFDTGTKAELAGGTTCIIDFATQNAGETLSEGLAHWHAKSDGNASCDYAFHLAISEWNDSVSKEIERVVKEGITSFKLYMTYDNMVDDKTLYEVLSRLKELGGIVGVHCENKGIIDARLKQLLLEKGNRESVADYPGTRPPEAEAEAINRLLTIAKLVDTPVIVVHLSTRQGFEVIQRARAEGQIVYVETCPQYLLMDESRYSLENKEARKYMIAPPLRTPEDQQVLWKALEEEQIQTVATDHCSFNLEQKQAGAGDFSQTPCGMPGAQERPALLYHYGVNGGRLTVMQVCKYLSENPAKQYGLYPRKGALLPGSDADIVVWDPKQEWEFTAETMQSAAGYCPMEGTKVKGAPKQVYLRGQLVAEDGKIVKEFTGTYITR